MTEVLNDQDAWTDLRIRVPPELSRYGPDLQRFFDAMIYKLRRNAHKGKWETVPMEKAIEMWKGECGELLKAVVGGSTSEILMESADVANMALIIANIAIEVRET